jgi:hypothetical protein
VSSVVPSQLSRQKPPSLSRRQGRAGLSSYCARFKLACSFPLAWEECGSPGDGSHVLVLPATRRPVAGVGSDLRWFRMGTLMWSPEASASTVQRSIRTKSPNGTSCAAQQKRTHACLNHRRSRRCDRAATHNFPKLFSKKSRFVFMCAAISFCRCLAPACQSSIV